MKKKRLTLRLSAKGKEALDRLLEQARLKISYRSIIQILLYNRRLLDALLELKSALQNPLLKIHHAGKRKNYKENGRFKIAIDLDQKDYEKIRILRKAIYEIDFRSGKSAYPSINMAIERLLLANNEDFEEIQSRINPVSVMPKGMTK